MRLRAPWALLKETFHQWNEDSAPRLGAALAYYSIFSLAPLLLVAIAIAGLVFGEAAAKGEVVAQLEQTVGAPTARALEQLIVHSRSEGSGTVAVIVSLVTLLVGASGVFLSLQDALNTIWKVKPRPGRGLRNFLRDRLLSFVMVLGTGFLLLVSVVISTTLAALGRYVTPEWLPGSTQLWQAVNAVVSLLFVTVLFALIFKVLPDVKIAWRDVWLGGLVTGVLFTAGKYLLALYLGRGSVTSAYGAAGSLVLILLWVYYSAQIALFGAEFTRVYASCYGHRVEPADNAVPVAPESETQPGMPCNRNAAPTLAGARPDGPRAGEER